MVRQPRRKSLTSTKAFYNLLLKRVGEMAAQGKSLAEIKKELKMPEYADWNGQERLGRKHRRGVEGGEDR